MKNNSVKILSLVVAAVIVIGVFIFLRPSKTETIQNTNPVTTEKTGGVNPDSPFPYQSFGGVRSFAGRTESLTQASTTLCAVQSPAATSTLVSGGIRLDFATSSQIVVDLARSTSPAATTTKIGATQTLASGASAVYVAVSTTTVSTSLDVTVFPPNNWFVVKMDNGKGFAGNAPIGVCQATFQAI